MLFFTIFVIFICVLFLEWFMNHREKAKVFLKIQGPPRALIVGNSLQVVVTPDVAFNKLRTWANSYKDFYRLWIIQHGIINIYSPQDIEILISNPKYNEKSILYDLVKPWLNDGLLVSKGNKWQHRRKILTPAFHFNILQQFTAVLQEHTAKFVEDIDTMVKEETLDVKPLMSDLTLNLICETSMGSKLNENSFGSGKIYKNAIHDIGQIVFKRVSKPWLVLDWVFNLTNLKQTQKQILKIIHDFPKRIISERRSYIEKFGIKIDTSDDNDVMFCPKKRRMAMLDLLLCAEKEGLIDEEGIQEEVDTFMFEGVFQGHDTTATGLIFALLELANNRDIQDKVFKEINDILRESSQTATMQDLGQMKYLECCIKETLRLYPPVPLISRSVSEGVILSGCTVPPGDAICHIHIFDLHRRADLYPDPLTFNPERFTPENSVNRHPYAYIPFSGGPRNCIGQRFAMLELKTVLSSIVRKYILEPVTRPEDLKFTADLVLRTTHPIHVKFVKRY